MFRRPKKPQRPRLVMTGNEDDEEVDMDVEAEPVIVPPQVTAKGLSESKNSNNTSDGTGNGRQIKSIKQDPSDKKQPTLLSFDEELEGDDGEVFKVKKSSVSRRLMKQRDREKKESKYAPLTSMIKNAGEVHKQSGKVALEPLIGNVKIKTESDLVTAPPVVRILNGREAEAVNMESSDDDDDGEDHDGVRFTGRHNSAASAITEELRRVLQQGQIPDAKLIHEARKRKQMARQMGGNPEFVPVDNVSRLREEKSRLVREDENDHSEDEERIDFTTATNAARIDRAKRIEAFNAARDEEKDRMSAGESDPEIEEWESNQIRKAVSSAKMQNVVKDICEESRVTGNGPMFMAKYRDRDNDDKSTSFDGFPIYSASSPVSSPARNSNSCNQQDLGKDTGYSKIDRASNGVKELKPEIILQELSERLEKMKLQRVRHTGELSRLEADLQLSKTETLEADRAKPELSSRFILYQNLRGYVTDLVDALRCKMPIIEDVENRLLELMKSRKERLAERRRQDVKDQKAEVDATVNILGGNPVGVPPPSSSDTRSRRVAEREGRRTRRKTLREKNGSNKAHKDGLSSDDEETEFEINSYKLQRESILDEANLVFDDVNEDFATVRGVLERFEEWRDMDFDSYKESYAYMCVPKCLAPLIRLQLLTWDPLMDSFDLLKFTWIKPLITFGYHTKETSETLSTDPDSRLIPAVAEKVVLPYIDRVINVHWDPMSDRQTRSLVNVLNKVVDEWAAGASCKTMHQLLSTVLSKFKEAVDVDVFIPIFPKTLMSNTFSPASVYASRQFWSSVKLLDNMSKWQRLICDRPLQTLALDALLTRYILLGIRTAGDLNESAERAKGVVNVLPRAWCTREPENPPPNGLLQLSRCLVLIVQSADCSIASNKVAISEIVDVLRTIGFSDEAQMIMRKYS